MHLWPTKNLRDSFKHSYLKRLEWNYQRMKVEKDQQQSSTQQKLLQNENQNQNNDSDTPNLLNCEAGSVTSLFQELLLVLSCCYCCFCCGGIQEKERKVLIHVKKIQLGVICGGDIYLG